MINVREILDRYKRFNDSGQFVFEQEEDIHNAIKEIIEHTLEYASANARCEDLGEYNHSFSTWSPCVIVDKESITDTIKHVYFN